MAEILSAGVLVSEIDASTIAPTVSNSFGVFSGDFVKGPVGVNTLITSVADLISFYGTPTNFNYNDFYQAYNFLQYGNKLLVSRAADIAGTTTDTTLLAPVVAGVADVVLGVGEGASFVVGDIIGFGATAASAIITQYTVANIVTDTLTLDRILTLAGGELIFTITRSINGVVEAAAAGGVTLTNDSQFINLLPIENSSDYEAKELSIAFSDVTSKLKFTARSVGTWSNGLEICVANSTAFGNATPSLAFPGVALDDLYEYSPTGTEFAIIIRDNGIIVETFTVDSDSTAKDHNNKSTYVENIINTQSNYVFCKDNMSAATVSDYCAEVNGVGGAGALVMIWGADGIINKAALIDAYSIFDNKEELDVDIVIANERDFGTSANALTETRGDCIGFIGANYADTVGKKSAAATTLLIDWRKATNVHLGDGADINYNNMFMVACGNYKYQYDRYNDKYRWINIAGDIAGLRAQTSTNRASWWASAGLERGQIKNVTKLAFNPTQGQRDLLYKNGINPIVAFPGQGTVMWGQKTLLDKPSSFDRVNVRGLFNTMERSLSKMAKYQVMEFNDNFTRNRIVSMIKPYLGSVQAGRGIQDFLVICDESNNTADIISRNQLIVDIYIKPTYVAEFIQLRFTNAGTNSFAEIIGG